MSKGYFPVNKSRRLGVLNSVQSQLSCSESGFPAMEGGLDGNKCHNIANQPKAENKNGFQKKRKGYFVCHVKICSNKVGLKRNWIVFLWSWMSSSEHTFWKQLEFVFADAGKIQAHISLLNASLCSLASHYVSLPLHARRIFSVEKLKRELWDWTKIENIASDKTKVLIETMLKRSPTKSLWFRQQEETLYSGWVMKQKHCRWSNVSFRLILITINSFMIMHMSCILTLQMACYTETSGKPSFQHSELVPDTGMMARCWNENA